MAQDWPNIVAQIGVPAFTLGFFLWGVYRSVKWLGPELLQPVARKAIEFLDSLQKTQEKQATVLDALAHRQEALAVAIQNASCKYQPCARLDCDQRILPGGK